MRDRKIAIHEAGHAVIALEMGFQLEKVTLGESIGGSRLSTNGRYDYSWILEYRRNPDDCARGRAMAVFAGVLAEAAVYGRMDAWLNFGQQKDDQYTLQEILDSKDMLDQEEADRWQRQIWRECEQLVLKKRVQILKVADALWKRGSLSGAEVRVLLLQPKAWSSRRKVIAVLTLTAVLVGIGMMITSVIRDN